MEIRWVGMTRPHYQSGRPGPIRALVIHATAGRGPGDLNWLRQGGDERRPVSCHYYIDKAGRISQLVRDEDTAWHAGVSRWTIDGRTLNNLNPVSIGIELENLNTGRDPYPAAQVAAVVALSRELVRRYNLPRTQVVRHLDISPGRKSDPAGFAWPTFLTQVYADQPAPPASDEAHLQALMLDLAYRAAGAALPAAWPLLAAARRYRLGMPVAMIGESSPAGAGTAQDDRERSVRVNGQALLVEVYARDLLYAPARSPADEPAPANEARRLNQTPAGPLRTALLEHLFRAADPLNGFQPGWAFHQRYLAQPELLGVPIGPSHRLSLGPRQIFTCQHFARQSLCASISNWSRVYTLDSLNGTARGLDAPTTANLRRALLDDLYRARSGRRYDRAALLIAYAEANRLGAPLAPPEVVLVGGQAYLLMPYALDVLACALPAYDWPLDRPLPGDTSIITLRSLLEASASGTTATIDSLTLTGPLSPLTGRPLLGAPSPQPSVLDLSPPHGRGRPRRPRPAPEAVLITTASGPAGLDLREEAQLGRWHYYIDTAGAIYRLCDEIYLGCLLKSGPLAERCVVVAVEGGAASAGLAQRAALSWLVRALAATLRIPPAAVLALDSAGLHAGETPAHPGLPTPAFDARADLKGIR